LREVAAERADAKLAARKVARWGGLITPSTSGWPDVIVTGLRPGRTYTFRVIATNAAGTGPSSPSSNAVRP